MDVTSEVNFINKAIVNQKLALKFHLSLAIGVICLGLIIFALTQILSGGIVQENKWVITIGAGFISTLSGFPFKEIFLRRDKVAALELILGQYEKYKTMSNPDNNEFEQLQKRFSNMIDKILGV